MTLPTPETIVAGFLPWVEAQDPAATYNYFDTRNCPLAQYAASLGFEPLAGGVGFYPDHKGPMLHVVPYMPNGRSPLAVKPWTFGALAARLKEL